MPIRVTDYINTTAPSDTYATHIAALGRGGFRSVMTIAERDAITAARTETGMWVNVIGSGIYEWNGSSWDKVNFGSGSFTGVITDLTLSGNGDTIPLTIPVSTDLNNIITVGSDGRLYVPADSGSGNFTGVITDITISGNGYGTKLGIPLSSDSGNILIYGTDGKIFVECCFTGVLVSPMLTGDGLNIPIGVPLSTDSGNALIYGTDDYLFAPGMDTYTNFTAMPEDVGGLEAGTSFTGVSITGLLDQLLYPYQYPTFSSFTFTQTSPLEVGDSVASGTKTFTWGTTNSSNIATNSIDIDDITASLSLASNIANDGTENINIDAVTKTVPNSHIWRISALNTRNGVIARDRTVSWQYRAYWGTSASGTLDEAGIESLTGTSLVSTAIRSYAHGTGNYKYICYPTGLGLRTSFLDGQQQLEVAMESAYIVNVTNSFGLSIPYYVHRTTNTLGASITINVS